MIPVSKVKRFELEHIGKLISYRKSFCVCFVGSRDKTVAATEFIDWCLDNCVTLPSYSERISEDAFSWNRAEYAMLSLTKDVIQIVPSDGRFGEDQLYLLNPYMVWSVASLIYDTPLPYPNQIPLGEDGLPDPSDLEYRDSIRQDKEYLDRLFTAGKREGWFECAYRYNNTDGKVETTADKFISVRNPKIVPGSEIGATFTAMTKKPWYPYQLARNEHTLIGDNGKWYVAVVYGGHVQFISEMGEYLDNAKVECVSANDSTLKPDQVATCARIIGTPVFEL